MDKKNSRTIRRLKSKLENEKNKANIAKIENQLEAFNEDKESSFKPKKDEEIYLMASCCDWMPVKMKTLRTLAIEKVHM